MLEIWETCWRLFPYLTFPDMEKEVSITTAQQIRSLCCIQGDSGNSERRSLHSKECKPSDPINFLIPQERWQRFEKQDQPGWAQRIKLQGWYPAGRPAWSVSSQHFKHPPSFSYQYTHPDQPCWCMRFYLQSPGAWPRHQHPQFSFVPLSPTPIHQT